MKVLEKWKKILHWNLSEKTKKILTTVLITLTVCAFFAWIGKGMFSVASETGREGMTPFYFMTVAFPLLVLVLSIIRVYKIFFKEETETAKPDDVENEE